MKELTLEQSKVQEESSEKYSLVLYNDDVNTFEWVITSLMSICDHTAEQAEQSAWIVHHKGKYAVLSGAKDYLKPRKEALELRMLSVKIE